MLRMLAGRHGAEAHERQTRTDMTMSTKLAVVYF
jgi:hypothetical protein